VINIIDVPIIGDSKNVPQDDPELTLNWYAEEVSKDVLTLKPTPGTVLHNQFSISGGGRGMVVVAGRLFGVRGGYFQEIVGGSPVVRGALSSNSGKVGICYNLPPNGEFQIMVVDETHGYVYESATDTWNVDPDSFPGGGSSVAFCAGRAFVFEPGTTRIRCSGLYEFTTWDTSAFVTAESLNTPILALVSNGELLYAFSSDGFQVFNNQGYEIQPMRPMLSGDKIGILAPFSALVSERFVYWLGGNVEGRGVIYRHDGGGGAPVRVSTHSIERNIAALSTPSDALGWTYQSLGHIFYALTFQAGNKTICLDTVTALWHFRAWREPVNGTLNAVPFIATAILDGEILGMDFNNGKVLRLDDTVFTDQGNPILRDRILTCLPQESDNLTFYQSAELFATIGNTPVGQPNPQIMMRYSKDRGMTWSFERWQTAGGNYTYDSRTKWTALGSAYTLALWFRVVTNQFVSWRSVRLRAE
jgi:hypothetical protein